MTIYRVIFLSIILVSFPTFASDFLVVEGKLTDSAGITPIESADVDFTLEVYDAGGTCLLYSETHNNNNMSGSLGFFGLELGNGTPVNNPNGPIYSIFDNAVLLNCFPSGTTGPVAAAPRVLKISYNANDGNGLQVLQQNITIGATAYAIEAQNAEAVGGVVAANILQANAGQNLTQANLEGIFSGGNSAELTALLGGSSTQYLQSPLAAGSITSSEIQNATIVEADLNITAGAAGPGQYLESDGAGSFQWSAPAASSGDFMANGSVPMTAAADMGGFVVGNVGTPGIAADAANKGYVDSSVANGNTAFAWGDHALAGYGTGSGDFMANGSVPMTAAADMGGFVVGNVGTPGIAADAANKGYVDSSVANGNTAFAWGDHALAGYGTGSGDFMANGSVPMTAAADMGGFVVGNVGTPGIAADAANKGYVDSSVANGNTAFAWGDHALAGYGTGDIHSGGDAGPVVIGSNDNSLSLEANDMVAMTIDVSGNVGIGISTPLAKLETDGPANFQSASITGGDPCGGIQQGQIVNDFNPPNELLQCDGSNWKKVGSNSPNPADIQANGPFDMGATQVASTTSSCGGPAFDLNFMVDGGVYKFWVQGTAAGACTLNFSSGSSNYDLTAVYPTGGSTAMNGTDARLYTLTVAGTNVLVTWTNMQ